MEYSLEIVLLAFVFGFLLGALFGYGLALISGSNRSLSENEQRPNAASSSRTKLNIQMSSTDVRDLSDRSEPSDRTMKLPMIGKLEPSDERFVYTDQTTLHISRSEHSDSGPHTPTSNDHTKDTFADARPAPATPSKLDRSTDNIPDTAEEATRLYEKPFTSNL